MAQMQGANGIWVAVGAWVSKTILLFYRCAARVPERTPGQGASD